MVQLIERLQVWQAYPALIIGVLAPWIDPIAKLGLVNKLWHPEIDWAADLLVALFVIVLLALNLDKREKKSLQRVLIWSCIAGGLSVAGCIAMRHLIIDRIDADWKWLLGDVPWGLAYFGIYLSVTSIVMSAVLLMSVPGLNNCRESRPPSNKAEPSRKDD